MPANPSRRYVVILITFSALLGITFVQLFRRQAIGTREPNHALIQSGSLPNADLLSGQSIMPRLGNETAKAELGRATWKYFHTVMARFPDKPTQEQSATLSAYIRLFQRLYPCGECAEHFGQILQRFPPQVSSRSAAAGWACHVHNEVNKSLKKDIFDCSNIGDFYDCGCADDEASQAGAGSNTTEKAAGMEKLATSAEKLGYSIDTDGRSLKDDSITGI